MLVLPPWKENSRQERHPTEIKAILTSGSISKTNPWNERVRAEHRMNWEGRGWQKTLIEERFVFLTVFSRSQVTCFLSTLFTPHFPFFSKGACWEALLGFGYVSKNIFTFFPYCNIPVERNPELVEESEPPLSVQPGWGEVRKARKCERRNLSDSGVKVNPTLLPSISLLTRHTYSTSEWVCGINRGWWVYSRKPSKCRLS